ncbi:hypothetical protein SDC9_170673 [bioreactor metagenome]|uniref:Tail fiber protein n=1 Tax=bioreactor metagenome TaxID=1076179 RepID=A0A645G9G2_9ZZZZ
MWRGEGVGSGQNWVDVTASRTFGAPYTNNTGRPIQISLSVFSGVAGGNFYHTVNGLEQIHLGAGGYNGQTISFIVPNNQTYSARTDASFTIAKWFELR